MVLSQSITPVAAGLLAGAALAAALATMLMSTAAASLIQGVVHVFDPVACVSSTLCIIVACAAAAAIPAARAARTNPIATLRQD
jgi:ABC-type antimicrobial peptide transport system permease subunit